jgi:hypothetical protein
MEDGRDGGMNLDLILLGVEDLFLEEKEKRNPLEGTYVTRVSKLRGGKCGW